MAVRLFVALTAGQDDGRLRTERKSGDQTSRKLPLDLLSTDALPGLASLFPYWFHCTYMTRIHDVQECTSM